MSAGISNKGPPELRIVFAGLLAVCSSRALEEVLAPPRTLGWPRVPAPPGRRLAATQGEKENKSLFAVVTVDASLYLFLFVSFR